jgi:hypothetical protein
MKIVKAVPGVPIQLGRRGEYGVTQVEFDLRDFIDTFGPGTAQLAASLPDTAGAYPVMITQKDATAVWEITAAWTASAGYGECQLSWYVGESLARSIVYRTQVAESLLPDGEVPAPEPDYLDQVQKLSTGATQAAEQADLYATAAEGYAGSAGAAANVAEGKAESASQSANKASASAREATTAAADAAVAKNATLAATARASEFADVAVREAEKATQFATVSAGLAKKAEDEAERARDFAHDAEEASKKNLVFIATYGETTYEELVEAYNAGKAMVLKHETLMAPFLYIEKSSFVFSTNNSSTYYNRWCTAPGTWGYRNIAIPTSNKVTALEASTEDLTSRVKALELAPSEVFVAKFDETTYDEIDDAIVAGKSVVLEYVPSSSPLTTYHLYMSVRDTTRQFIAEPFCFTTTTYSGGKAVLMTAECRENFKYPDWCLEVKELFYEDFDDLSGDVTRLERTVGDFELALDAILAMQNSLIGGNA